MEQLADYIYNASSNLSWMLGTTFAFLLLFHWLWVKRWPFTAKQWKAVEYVWVLLAFLSALGLVDESRRVQAEAHIVMDQAQAEKALNSLHNWFVSYADYACAEDDTVNHVVGSLHNSGLQHTSLQQQCPKFQQAVLNFNLILETEGAIPPLQNNLIDLPQETFPEEHQTLTQRFETYQQARTDYLASLAATKRSMIQRTLTIFAPLLFSIAIALKLTKVTGEYRLTK